MPHRGDHDPESGTGDTVLATVTDDDGNTSEFSAPVEVTSKFPLIVKRTADAGDANPAGIEEANAYPGPDAVFFDIPADRHADQAIRRRPPSRTARRVFALMATDTLVIKDGKISVQTFAAYEGDAG